ncbi:tetratricopeptide repeat protein [bacterium]|nr:tetratricopeptide repeat protein [bacterium]
MHFLTEGVEFWRMCEKAADECKTSDVPPDNLDGKISYAACLASEGEFVQALNVLLEVLETDKSFRDGLARKATVSIFVVMGLTNPVVKEYQSRLAQLLF